MIQRIKHSLLGISDEQGVANVGGRLGAVLGPKHFRGIWSRFQWNDQERKYFDDVGDLTCSPNESLDLFHERITTVISPFFKQGHRVIVIGGGHDFAIPFVRAGAHSFSGQKIGCINLDAHFDLRPKIDGKITSGSPFRILIEEGSLNPKNLIEFGIQKQSNHPDLFQFAKNHSICTVMLSDIQKQDAFSVFKSVYEKLDQTCDVILISLDLDVFSQSAAPGVSAPQAEGLNVSDVFRMLSWVSKHEKVKGLGVFELNPLQDVNEATARLAATAVYRFIDGDI